ncbi:DUF977 family protein [Thermogymnomonas acidicola]|uniref:DUF977 family protein n=1 Tax=Thermogymnomonas acidicola TaxID=399579 RepID=UPI001396B213|nr:DUF977 family protein [Thermogymnomonas acidicola]
MVSDRADIESMMITLLQRDARMSLTDLSERLGVTRVTASKVLRSLLERGVLGGLL